MRSASSNFVVSVDRELDLLHLIGRGTSLRFPTIDLLVGSVLLLLVGEVSADVARVLSILSFELDIGALTLSGYLLTGGKVFVVVFVSINLSHSSFAGTITSLACVGHETLCSWSRTESGSWILLPGIVRENFLREEASTVDIDFLLNDFVANSITEHI